MPTPQSAICAPGSAHAIFLTFCAEPGRESALRAALAILPRLTRDVGAAVGEPDLLSAIGVGALVWPRLFAAPAPDGLRPFESLGEGARRAPATPADIFVHIRSPRHDANFALAREVSRRLADSVTLVEEIHAFRNHEDRDLTGFVDGTENPLGEQRALVALVPDGSGPHAGGSYVSVQRYVHGHERWSSLSESEQESVIGRTKRSDEELADDVKPPTAHIARVVIEEDGAELEILRHSLPYGTTVDHGIYFVAYGSRPEPFFKMLRRMVIDDAEGHHDRLLDFTRAVTGASFFVPSVEFLSG